MCLHCLNIASVYLYISFNEISLSAEPPITHCFQHAENSSSVEFWSSESNNYSLSILEICKNVECLPKIRLCSATELPNDLFFKKVGPIGFLLLLISLCSAACLQILGSYYDLFQWSRNIVHLSLIHDFLRNSDSLADEIVVEMNELIWREIKTNRDIVNNKDHLYGDTCLHAALDSDSYEFIEKMSDLDFPDFSIENTFGENTIRPNSLSLRRSVGCLHETLVGTSSWHTLENGHWV